MLGWIPMLTEPSPRGPRISRQSGVTLYAHPMRPESKGEIHITAADPRRPPAINFNFLSSPPDAELTVHAVRIAREIMTAPAMTPFQMSGTRFIGRSLATLAVQVYRAQPCELCDRDGSVIPFARTEREREAAGDPRPSLEERYGTREAYVAKVKAAAEALVADRLVLPSDAAGYVKAAEECDRF